MKVRGGGGGGAYSRGVLICYFGQEGGRLFGGGHLLERGRLFEEIRYSYIFRATMLLQQCFLICRGPETTYK